MSDDIDEHDGSDHSYPSAADPVLIAFTLIDLALNPKAAKAGLKKLAQVDKSIGVAEQKLAALIAEAEQTKAALAEREAAVVARETAHAAREAAFESQAGDVRDELREHHARLEQTHRQLVRRLMATAGITGNWNFDLQDPPTWAQLKRMIADLPDDLPVAPPAEVVSENVRHDWAGSGFIPDSSLTRTVRGAA
jgi:hypothetical protein